jgi:hypothetical protein
MNGFAFSCGKSNEIMHLIRDIVFTKVMNTGLCNLVRFVDSFSNRDKSMRNICVSAEWMRISGGKRLFALKVYIFSIKILVFKLHNWCFMF